MAVVQTVAAVTEAIAPAPLASAAAAAAASSMASTEIVTIHSQRSSLSQTPEEDEDDEEESSPSRTTRGTSSKHRRQKLVMMMEEQKKPEAVEAAEDSFHRLSSAVASGVKIKVHIVQIVKNKQSLSHLTREKENFMSIVIFQNANDDRGAKKRHEAVEDSFHRLSLVIASGV